jgi:hypothetical protein
MRPHTVIRSLAAVLLAAGALSLAACGGEPSAATADPDKQARDAALEHAQCMREHGVDMPDPSANGGRLRFQVGGDSGISPKEFEEAQKACSKYMKGIKPRELSEEEQQESKDAALAHARCIREHGIENFPDPTFGANGEAQLRIDKNMGIDHDELREAEKACEDTLPKGAKQEAAP